MDRKMLSIEDLRNIKGFGKKMEERVKKYTEQKEEKNKHDNRIQKITSPEEYRINLDSIYQGESVEFMRRNIPSNSIDMVLTSPPYDNLREYNGYIFHYKQMLQEIYRVLKDGGVCVWVVGDATVAGSETGTSFRQALYAKNIGFNLHDTMIYAKNNPIPLTHNRYEQQFEYMFIFSKGRPKTFNPIMVNTVEPGGRLTITQREKDGSKNFGSGYGKTRRLKRQRYNIWHYNVGSNQTTKDKIAHNHPAIFPEKLAEDHILSWSNEGDIVLDPMCGSGTTCKMAKLNNRRFIGVDISDKYVELSKTRCDIK